MGKTVCSSEMVCIAEAQLIVYTLDVQSKLHEIYRNDLETNFIPKGYSTPFLHRSRPPLLNIFPSANQVDNAMRFGALSTLRTCRSRQLCFACWREYLDRTTRNRSQKPLQTKSPQPSPNFFSCRLDCAGYYADCTDCVRFVFGGTDRSQDLKLDKQSIYVIFA